MGFGTFAMSYNLFSKLRRSNTKDELLVSLDIGTEFVKALICKVGQNSLEVIGAGRQRQRLTDMAGGAVTDIAGVVDNCDTALRAAEKMAGRVAKNVVIGIAGELVKGTTTIVKYKRLEPTAQIEAPELKRILERVQWKAFQKAREQLAWETGLEEIEVKLVNTAVTDVQIDGYRVTNPIGFQGKSVSIQLFNAFAPMVHLGALQTVASSLDLNLISVAAEPFAVAKGVGDQDSAEFSAIFIDIGGGTTDIALVNNGGVEGTKMFAIGGRTFTKRIAQQVDIGFEEAERLKLEMSANKLPKDKQEQVAGALAADIEVWLSGVQLSLGEFDRIDHLPSRVLLCGGGAGLPQIIAALEGSEWSRSLPFAKPPSVKLISPKQVSRVIDTTGTLMTHADITPMALASIGLDVQNTGSAAEGIMAKLSKAVQP